ncbi:hypothetical protein [Mucilaginibacter phenanthrenivorans]|uniref:hypothetical protein n=1 Tax=Mucilaginibacter phenanthrenivorans TaxID=1234842 RepID=UPI0021589E48|nr:hypothetical protein [Mucilaginibacter phenanthrenivorans]
MKIISGILILITVFFSFRHGWGALTMKYNESEAFSKLGISKPVLRVVGVLTLLVGVFVLFPDTFFAGNVLNAVLILSILVLQLRAGNLKAALIEIPFLPLPLVMIWLGYPLGNS